jgi:hypothetical protein
MKAMVLSLTLALMACSLPGSDDPVLPDDGPPVAVSSQAAASFAGKVLAGASGLTGGTLSFSITQEEATSALAYATSLSAVTQGLPPLESLPGFEGMDPQDLPEELRQLEGLGLAPSAAGSDGPGLLPDLRLLLVEPQVYFKADGRLILRGVLRIWRSRLPLRVVLAPHAADGELEFDFVEGQISRLPMPVFLFDPLGRLLASTLLAGQDFAEISHLQVSEGRLDFSGTLRMEALPVP